MATLPQIRLQVLFNKREKWATVCILCYPMTTVIEPEVVTPPPPVTIRVATPGDLPAICSLYPSAFPEEDLLPLIHDLHGLGPSNVISLVGVSPTDCIVVGSVYFTLCTVVDYHHDDAKYESADYATLAQRPVALLGPLCVHPTHQKQGIGSALVKSGIEWLQKQQPQSTAILVLGSPVFYSRFGFQQEINITTPYALPSKWASAWQSMDLDRLDKKVQEKSLKLRGRLVVPLPWQREKLWS
jgi:putative acetyltransferase